jgi:hypothetical protein
VTARDVARAAGAAAPAERALLDALQAALALFSAARYPQAPARDAAALSDALSRAADAAGRLARTRRRRRLLW